MKRIFQIMGLVLTLTMAQSAMGQVKWRIGVTGGASLKETVKSIDQQKADWSGWYAGPVLEVSLPLGFKVDGSVQYSQNKVDLDGEKVNVNYISIPFNLKMNFSALGLVGVYVSGGIQFDNKLNNDKHALFATENFALKKNCQSFNLGAGVRVLKKVQLGVTYNIPTNQKSKGQENYTELRKNTLSIGAMVLF